MKKYKLIKRYPGSPPIGTFATEDKYGQYVTETLIIFGKDQVKNYPEYWEEVRELPEYVRCIHCYGNAEIGKIYKTDDNALASKLFALTWEDALITYKNLNDSKDTWRAFISSTQREYEIYIQKNKSKIGDWVVATNPKEVAVGQYTKGNLYRVIDFANPEYDDALLTETDDRGSDSNGMSRKYFRLATNDEIEKYLIAEAVKRGFVKGNSFISSIDDDGKVRKIIPYEQGFGSEIAWQYRPETDILRSSSGLCVENDGNYCCSNPAIYEKGKWVEIVKEKEEIKIAGYEAIYSYGYDGVKVSFGCRGYTFKQIEQLYLTMKTFTIQTIKVIGVDELVGIAKVEKIYNKMNIEGRV